MFNELLNQLEESTKELDKDAIEGILLLVERLKEQTAELGKRLDTANEIIVMLHTTVKDLDELGTVLDETGKKFIHQLEPHIERVRKYFKEKKQSCRTEGCSNDAVDALCRECLDGETVQEEADRLTDCES